MTSPARAAPIVSVVIATYNRCETLRCAIESVRDSTLDDWELVVVGDACTDDTAATVAAFGDPRIRFENLAERCGSQSGPNNRGIELARGRYIAFLSHDDLYFPEHLATCVGELEESGADLVWVPCAKLLTEAESERSVGGGRFAVSGAPGMSGYSPSTGYFASSWVLRRSLAARVGPWPTPEEQFVTPSQAWLFRAWRMGADLRFLPRVGVILVPAGRRPGCYGRSESPEHEWLSQWMTGDSRCRERILEEAAVHEAMERAAAIKHPSPWAFRRLLLGPIYALLARLGVHPASLRLMLRYGGRGNVIREHRKRTAAR